MFKRVITDPSSTMSKNKSTEKLSNLETLRSASAYQSGRSLLGLPFRIAGWLNIIVGAMALLTAFGSEVNPIALGIAVTCFFSGLFCFGLSALGLAIFDIADCSVWGESRARHQELLARQQAEQSQHLFP